MPAEGHANGLADPALRRALVDYVKRRVSAADVDDVVQTVLVDALEARERPAEREQLRRWVLGVARHKVVDLHRRKGRDPVAADPELDVPDPALEAPVEERSLALWAERQVGERADAKQTLDILAREGEGEKLESIAADERLPPATVRQRVSRMRKFLRDRWKAELALVAAIGVLALVVWSVARAPQGPEAQRDPSLAPSAEPIRRAAELRREAGKRCDEGRWVACLRGLDDAKGLDPDGDRAPEIGALRKLAEEALRPAPAPTSSSRIEPTPQQPGPQPTSLDQKKPEEKTKTNNTKPSPKEQPEEARPRIPAPDLDKKVAPKAPAPKAPAPLSTGGKPTFPSKANKKLAP